MADKLLNLTEILKDLGATAETIPDSLNHINDAVLKTGKGYDGVVESISGLKSSLESIISIGEKNLPAGMSSGMSKVKTVMEGVTNVASGLESAFMGIVKSSDVLSAVNRTLLRENFALAAQFGTSMSSVEEFNISIMQNALNLKDAEMGYQNVTTEVMPMIRAMMGARLSIEQINETIVTSAGSFKLYEMAVLQATSLGMTQESYVNNMSQLMVEQGMSAQQAAGTLATYKDISSDTGISIQKVSQSLGTLGNAFKNAGLDANFGESFLRGFASAIEDTSIGIENAAEMAKSFGESLGRLSTNYGSAFITATRGGMDLGSGGALGAGIQLQAKLLDKDTDQAELGKEVAGSIRETLESFTGGDIVTVKEAATGDPALERAYYTQTQILSKMYGIQDPTQQARTLEMLEELAQAEVSGDLDEMARIGQNLQEATGLRDKSLSNEEKLQTTVNSLLMEAMSQTSYLRAAALASEAGRDMIVEPLADVVDRYGFDTEEEAMKSLMSKGFTKEQAELKLQENKEFIEELKKFKEMRDTTDRDSTPTDKNTDAIALLTTAINDLKKQLMNPKSPEEIKVRPPISNGGIPSAPGTATTTP